MSSLSVRPVCGEFLVHVVGAEIELLSLTMLRAGLGHEDLAFTLEYGARKDSVAFRAYALGPAYETPNLLQLRL